MDMILGTWNVLTLNKPGAQASLLSELKKYKIALTAVQETKWLGKGIRDTKTHTIAYSGKDSGKKEFGVAFIIDSKIKHNILEFEPVNERLCKLRIKSKFFNVSIINAHSPTEEHDIESKEVFYDQLEEIYDNCPRNDVKIIIGDLNAQVGKEEQFMGTIGRHSLHEVTNENGEFLINFATRKNMVISSTFFPHKEIHKATWIMPGGAVANQIDHVLIDKRTATSILDVKSRRGACCGSDHLLVQIKFRCKITRNTNKHSQPTEQLDVEKLKQMEVRESFEIELTDRILNTNSLSSDEHWDKLKTEISETATRVIGNRKKEKRADWYDEDCKGAIEERNEAHRIYMERRTRERRINFENARRKADKICRNRKRKYDNSLIQKMESDFQTNDLRTAYKHLRQLREGYKPRTTLCKNAEGQLTSDPQEVKGTWKTYFQTLLGTQMEEEEGQILNMPREEHEEELGPPTLDEVRQAIMAQRNNKAPGIDNLPSELYKLGGEHLITELHSLFSKIWREENIPTDWKTGIICPIYKKGDKLTCENYRGITLLCTAYKIFTYILNKRLQNFSESLIGEYQTGFRRGRSTIDQLFSVKQILSKAWEYDIDVYSIFVDFKQAYDSINRNQLYQILLSFSIPSKYIRLIKATMDSTMATVRIQNEMTDVFQISKGLKQGDGLAPTLFNLALEYVIRQMDIGRSDSLINKSVQIAAYADDINIMSRRTDELTNVYTQLKREAKTIGLEINMQKTKTLTQTRTRRHVHRLRVDDNIEEVQSFTYLGVKLTTEGSEESEVQSRITSANRTYFALSHILRSKTIHRQSKLKVYKTIIRPILCYGCETWVMTESAKNKIDVFERKVLRKIFGPIKENEIWRRRYNYELYHLFKDAPISEHVRLQRLRWAGHVVRMGDDRMPRRVLDSNIQGKRPRGRPRKRWENEVAEDAQRLMSVRTWKRVARDRQCWRQKLTEAKAQFGL